MNQHIASQTKTYCVTLEKINVEHFSAKALKKEKKKSYHTEVSKKKVHWSIWTSNTEMDKSREFAGIWIYQLTLCPFVNMLLWLGIGS